MVLIIRRGVGSSIWVYQFCKPRVLIIPNKNGNLKSYNELLSTQTKHQLKPIKTQEKRITNIAFNHPILKNVFEEKISNFQYPSVQVFYPLSTTTNRILSFEDQQAFLVQFKSLFVFTAPVESEASNFIHSPLIVPTLYNIGRSSLKTPPLHYWIGAENNFDLKVNLQRDRILKLSHKDSQFIPLRCHHVESTIFCHIIIGHFNSAIAFAFSKLVL